MKLDQRNVYFLLFVWFYSHWKGWDHTEILPIQNPTESIPDFSGPGNTGQLNVASEMKVSEERSQLLCIPDLDPYPHCPYMQHQLKQNADMRTFLSTSPGFCTKAFWCYWSPSTWNCIQIPIKHYRNISSLLSFRHQKALFWCQAQTWYSNYLESNHNQKGKSSSHLSGTFRATPMPSSIQDHSGHCAGSRYSPMTRAENTGTKSLWICPHAMHLWEICRWVIQWFHIFGGGVGGQKHNFWMMMFCWIKNK